MRQTFFQFISRFIFSERTCIPCGSVCSSVHAKEFRYRLRIMGGVEPTQIPNRRKSQRIRSAGHRFLWQRQAGQDDTEGSNERVVNNTMNTQLNSPVKCCRTCVHCRIDYLFPTDVLFDKCDRFSGFCSEATRGECGRQLSEWRQKPPKPPRRSLRQWLYDLFWA